MFANLCKADTFSRKTSPQQFANSRRAAQHLALLPSSASWFRSMPRPRRFRQANIADNVALEEIVEALIRKAAGGFGYHSDPYEARAALLARPCIEGVP